jgi:hypothetical protein
MCGRERHGGGKVRLPNLNLQCLHDCDRFRRIKRTIILPLILLPPLLFCRNLSERHPEAIAAHEFAIGVCFCRIITDQASRTITMLSLK